MKEEEASQLLRGVAAGDERAFRRLYEGYFGAVKRTLVRVLSNDADREEAANEAFHEVWNRAAQFESRSSVRTWITSIALNQAKMIVRRKSAKKRGSDVLYGPTEPTDSDGDDHGEDQTAGGIDPRDGFEHLVEIERIQALMRCMDELTTKLRSVFGSRLVEGKTVQETAATLEVPEGTVKSQLHEATKRVMECLRRKGFGAQSLAKGGS